MIAHLEVKGTGPLLMSTQRGADPTDALVKELASLTRIPGPKKTDEVHEKISQLQFELNLHWINGLGVVMPAINCWNTIRDAARGDKQGKDVDKYLSPLQPYFKLIYNGPQTKEGLLADKTFFDTRLVNHGTGGRVAMVICTRPVFAEWSFAGDFRVNQDKIDPPDFDRWVEEAGTYLGLMAFRKFFGRFETVVTWGSEK